MHDQSLAPLESRKANRAARKEQEKELGDFSAGDFLHSVREAEQNGERGPELQAAAGGLQPADGLADGSAAPGTDPAAGITAGGPAAAPATAAPAAVPAAAASGWVPPAAAPAPVAKPKPRGGR